MQHKVVSEAKHTRKHPYLAMADTHIAAAAIFEVPEGQDAKY